MTRVSKIFRFRLYHPVAHNTLKMDIIVHKNKICASFSSIVFSFFSLQHGTLLVGVASHEKKSFVHYFSYFSLLWWLLLIATTPTSATTYIVWFKPFDLTPNKELSRLLSFNHITHKVRTTNLIIIVKLN